MATYTKFYSFVESLAEKEHNLGSDSLKVALTLVAPSQSNTVLGNLTEIVYTNLSARAITTSSSAQTTGTYKLVLSDLTLTASGGAVAGFRYVVVYNDTAASDQLIAYYDYGSTVTLNDGETFTVNFDPTNGFLQLA